MHVGGAVSYRTSQVNVEESPIGSVSSDGVTSMFPAALLEADIPDMGSELKGVIEFLYTAPRFMIQSEYFSIVCIVHPDRTLIVRMEDIYKEVFC